MEEARKELNTYQTTLHVINSAIVKLGKLTKATKVYRGMSGMLLPESFRKPNEFLVAGGIEHAFMSTTLDRDVAFAYAKQADKASTILEIKMVRRGCGRRGRYAVSARKPSGRQRAIAVPRR